MLQQDLGDWQQPHFLQPLASGGYAAVHVLQV
jgi:hypothetical protein